METDKRWFQRKDVKWGLILVLVQAYLILGHILPAYEKKSYFQTRIDGLEQQKATLETDKQHIQFYKQNAENRQRQLELITQFLNTAKTTYEIQSVVSKSFQANKLELVAQQIGKKQILHDLTMKTISLTLKGSYSQHLAFLKDMENLNPFLTLSQCELKNTSPLSPDPLISMTASLTLYLPPEK